MQGTLLLLALQLQVAAYGPAVAQRPVGAAIDSQRIARRAHDAQSDFERSRRFLLPSRPSGGGACDVRIGRYCWWNEDGAPLPQEPQRIAERRARLLTELDSLGALLPGDDWLAGIRVFYRIEARQLALADSVAQQCRASTWWCSALAGYAAHARGSVRADSSFAASLAQMSDALRCAWRDISTLLPGDARGHYEELACDEREPLEMRYWMLSNPRLSAGANEWRAEFYARRVVAALMEKGRTPFSETWGDDTEELGLRYGWPVAWSRIQPANAMMSDVHIMGHDATPSFPFAPREELLDSLASGTDDGWDLLDRRAPSRFAAPPVRRILPVQSQLARFRRGDSTLLVAAYRATHDSLRTPSVALAAAMADGRTVFAAADSAHAGRLTLLLPDEPRLAGVELSDTATGTLARSRQLYAPATSAARRQVSDLLIFRADDDALSQIDTALARALEGDIVSRTQPVGVYWETYGTPGDSSEMNVEVTVERIDRGFFRAIRQRVGLADADSPLRMRWAAGPTAPDGVAPRSISLHLDDYPGGRYRITLLMTAPGGVSLVSAREIELTN